MKAIIALVSLLALSAASAQIGTAPLTREPLAGVRNLLPAPCVAGATATLRTRNYQCGSDSKWYVAGTSAPVPLALSLTDPPFSAQCNGTSDDTSALNSAASTAHSAGGGAIELPAGTCTTSTGVPLYSNVSFIGEGINATFVKLKSGSNTDVFYGTVYGYGSTMVNYSANWETGSATGISNWSISDLTIDGNNVNQQSGGTGIRQYGYQFQIQNVNIQNTFGDCLYSDYNVFPSQATSQVGSIQAQLYNMNAYHCGIDPTNTTIYTVGAVGIRWGGPTDAQWANITTFQNASHGVMIGPNGGGAQISSLHSWGPHTGNNSVSALFEGGSDQCSNCEFEGSDTVQLVLLSGQQSIFGGHIFQPQQEQASSIGIQLGQLNGSNTYAGVYYQQVPGSPTPAPGSGVIASSDGDFISTKFDNIWGGALDFINEQLGQYVINTTTSQGAYVQGNPAGTSTWSIFGTGLTCANTLATCGGTRLLSGNATAFTISETTTNGPVDLLDFSSLSRLLALPNGSALQLYSDNYITKTYGLGVSGHGLSYNAGAEGFIDAYAAGGWKDGGGWAYTPTSPQAITTGSLISRNINSYEYETIPVAPSGVVTGVILQPGATDGQQITVVNTSSYQITFAAAGTGTVADGASDTIAPLRAATFRWLAATGLWYRVGSS